jgi:phage recombination protein Bet
METSIEVRQQKIADQVKVFTQEEVNILKNTIAKGATDLELAYFLNVAKVYDLNPFTKQIWFYKNSQNQMIVFAGRDGFLSKAQRDPRWSGIASDFVREGETFSMNVAEGKISHDKQILSKGKIIGAWCKCQPKGCDIATIEWADFETYNKGYNVWKSDPAAMIKKVAESHCLAKAYGLAGLAIEEDFDIKDNVAYVRDHEERPTLTALGWADELNRRSTYDESMKEIIEAKLCDQTLTNSELEKIVFDLKENQPKEY